MRLLKISEYPQEKLSSAERLFCTVFWQVGFGLGLPEPEAQYRWHPTRRFTADFAFLNEANKLLIEIDAGHWSRKGKSGHTSGKGFERDREKDLLALELGYITVRLTPKMLENDPQHIFEVLTRLYSVGLSYNNSS